MSKEKKICWWQSGQTPGPNIFSFIREAYRDAQHEYEKALRDLQEEILPDPDLWHNEDQSGCSFFLLPSSIIIGEIRGCSLPESAVPLGEYDFTTKKYTSY